MTDKPTITRTNKGWRVDLPNGDLCYQPSESFAISYVRRWQVAKMMSEAANQIEDGENK